MLAVASAYPGLPRSGELVRPNAGASDRAECSQCSFACRVFLNGKVHNEYRKGLNCLFTRQALGYGSHASLALRSS